uniref:Uncharacterized protein n=1 Tax=Romanomermis culicivorax TaxID=13658 RepID=A0A915IXF1_ROMCU
MRNALQQIINFRHQLLWCQKNGLEMCQLPKQPCSSDPSAQSTILLQRRSLEMHSPERHLKSPFRQESKKFVSHRSLIEIVSIYA